MNLPSSPVRISLHDGCAVITLDRSERRNALNLEIKNLIADAIVELENDSSVHAIIITGAGGYFVAGTDIAEMADMTPLQHSLQATGRVFEVLRACPKPLIAAVEGYALGGGCELALSCDIIIAGRSARFGQPEINVGIMPGAGGTQRLLRTIGKYQTALLTMTGDAISAELAFANGMVSQLCEDNLALETALQIAQKIATKPPLAIKAIKELLSIGQDAPLSTMLSLERKTFTLLFDTEDQKEGMRAFLEKRRPQYKGR
ncbi:enoyl-CoA hydratase-related protein [Pseudomonas sp. JAI120]|uniref:enoyl-CoA hydratase-related protein n=1 Tax=Pseudomonas sp. JAI120 TaxID=2723063 RepID=UPI0030D79A6F